MDHPNEILAVVLNLKRLGSHRGGDGASQSILNIKLELRKWKHFLKVGFLKFPGFVFAWNSTNPSESSGHFGLITRFGWKLYVSLMNKNGKAYSLTSWGS